jgi:hypothetical protein
VVLAVALVAPPPPRITAHLRTDSNISTTALKPDQTYYSRKGSGIVKDSGCLQQCMARTRTGCRWLSLQGRSRRRSSSPD